MAMEVQEQFQVLTENLKNRVRGGKSDVCNCFSLI